MRLQKKIQQRHLELLTQGRRLKQLLADDPHTDPQGLWRGLVFGAFFAGVVWQKLAPNSKLSKVARRAALSGFIQSF